MSVSTQIARSAARALRSSVAPKAVPAAMVGSSRTFVATASRSTPLRAHGKRPTAWDARDALSSRAPAAIRSMFIQTESTPNDDSLKFIPGVPVLSSGGTAEFLDTRASLGSPLALRLFGVEGVTSVFYGPDFVTVSKDTSTPWNVIKPEVYSILMEHFSSGQPLFRDAAAEAAAGPQDTKILDTDSETVAMIKELLDTRVRPAIMEDGGDIEYRGFDEESGLVQLKLKGSCRGCESSSVTLKSGIERMLMHYIPEVKSVQQVLDVEEKIALSEFDKLEKKLAEKEKRRQDLSQYLSV